MQPNWTNTLKYARFSNLAFSSPNVIVDTCLSLGYIATCIEVGDSFCFIAESKDENIICFRGSDSLEDLKTDLGIGFYKNRNEWNVHVGFLRSWEQLKSKIVPVINHCDYAKPFVICGHSLGGALSLLCSAYLAEFIHNIDVCVFACPRVGKGKWKRIMENHMQFRGLKIYSIVNGGDIIPSLPWRIFGWRTIGDVFEIGKRPSIFNIPKRVLNHACLRYIRNLILKIKR